MTVRQVGPGREYATDGVNDEVQLKAAFDACSAGDAVEYDNLFFGNRLALANKTNVTLRPMTPETWIRRYSWGGGASKMIEESVTGSLDGLVWHDLKLDCSGAIGSESGGATFFSSAVQFSQNHEFKRWKIVDADGPSLTFGAVKGSLIEDLEIVHTVIPTVLDVHDIDMDIGGGGVNGSGLTFRRIISPGWGQRLDGFKIEANTGCVVEDSIIGGRISIGDDISTTDIGLILRRTRINGWLWLNLRSAGSSLLFEDNQYDKYRGVVIVYKTTGAVARFRRDIFWGPNSFVGWNKDTQAFQAVAGIVDENCLYPGAREDRAVHVFASHNDTGAVEYNTVPHPTPASASNNYRAVSTDAKYAASGRAMALRSDLGVQSWSGLSNMGIAQVVHHIGWPGEATVDMTGATGDFINGTLFLAGSSIHNFHIINQLSEGAASNQRHQALRCSGGGGKFKLGNWRVTNFNGVNGAHAGMGMYLSGVGCEVEIFGDVIIENGQGAADGCAVYVDASAKVRGRGWVTKDITTSTATGVVRMTATSDVQVSGGATLNCAGGANCGGIYNQNGANKLDGWTFDGNTATAATKDVYNTGVGFTMNSILTPAATNIGGMQAVTCNNSISRAGALTGSGNQTANYTFKDSAGDDYRLTEDSPGRKDGVAWWTLTEPRRVAANGNAYPDHYLDVGGYQNAER